MRERLLLILVVTACGARSTPPVDTPDLGGGSGAGTAAKPGRIAANLPQNLIDATKGKRLFVEDFTSMMLFSDERLAAQQIIADWATANGLTIVPPATVEDRIARAARGLDADTGKACGPALNRQLAVERWIDADGHVLAGVYCKDDCEIQVEINLRDLGTEYYAAAFDTAKPWKDELTARLGTVVDNGGHERYGHANNPVEVTGVKRGADDLVANRDAEVDLGPDGPAIAKRCGLTGLDVSVLIDGAGGHARCERYADPFDITETDPTIVGCACDQITTRKQPTRRQIVRILAPGVAPDRVKTASGHWASAELIGGNEYRRFGVAWFMPGQIYYKVSQCFAARTALEEDKEVNATIEFDRDGSATKATIADVSGLLSPAEQDCLRTAMRTLRTPCPAEANPTGTARISWRVFDP